MNITWDSFNTGNLVQNAQDKVNRSLESVLNVVQNLKSDLLHTRKNFITDTKILFALPISDAFHKYNNRYDSENWISREGDSNLLKIYDGTQAVFDSITHAVLSSKWTTKGLWFLSAAALASMYGCSGQESMVEQSQNIIPESTSTPYGGLEAGSMFKIGDTVYTLAPGEYPVHGAVEYQGNMDMLFNFVNKGEQCTVESMVRTNGDYLYHLDCPSGNIAAPFSKISYNNPIEAVQSAVNTAVPENTGSFEGCYLTGEFKNVGPWPVGTGPSSEGPFCNYNGMWFNINENGEPAGFYLGGIPDPNVPIISPTLSEIHKKP